MTRTVVLVLKGPASGKTTLARALAASTGLPQSRSSTHGGGRSVEKRDLEQAGEALEQADLLDRSRFLPEHDSRNEEHQQERINSCFLPKLLVPADGPKVPAEVLGRARAPAEATR